MSVNDSAQRIADVLAPAPPSTRCGWRWGTVTANNGNGTAQVQVGGSVLTGVRLAHHVRDVAAGDRVQVCYFGTDAIVMAAPSNGAPRRGDYVGAFYSSNNTATITLPRAGRYVILAMHNSTPGLNGIAFATGDTVFKVAGAASITFSRSGLTITATTTGGNPGYYVTAYDF